MVRAGCFLGREAATERNEDILHMARSSGMREAGGLQEKLCPRGDTGFSKSKKVKGTSLDKGWRKFC